MKKPIKILLITSFSIIIATIIYFRSGPSVKQCVFKPDEQTSAGVINLLNNWIYHTDSGWKPIFPTTRVPNQIYYSKKCSLDFHSDFVILIEGYRAYSRQLTTADKNMLFFLKR